jgi:hypothetical protein
MKRVFIAFILLTLSMNVYLQGYLPQEEFSVNQMESPLPERSMLASVPGEELLLYPNTGMEGEIRFNRIIRAEVFNVLGQKVQTVSNQNFLNISAFNKGIYVLRTQEGQIRKFVVGK